MSNDIEELAIKCGATVMEVTEENCTVIEGVIFFDDVNDLQAYTNEIIERCAIEAETEFKHNSYHVADLIRNLKG